jgi:hypothetical protein
MTDTHNYGPGVDRVEPSLLVRRGVVVGISLLTAAGWLVYDIGHPAQRAQGLAEIRRHFPEMLERPELLEREAAAGAEAAPAEARPEGGRPDSEEVAPRAGFEPATNRLTAGCSTTELPGNLSLWPSPKLGKWWGVFMGRQERHWPQMVNKWLTPRFPQGHLGHRSWFSSS